MRIIILIVILIISPLLLSSKTYFITILSPQTSCPKGTKIVTFKFSERDWYKKFGWECIGSIYSEQYFWVITNNTKFIYYKCPVEIIESD